MSHFLSAVVEAAKPFALQIERTGTLLGSSLVVAGDSASRRQGLLGRDGLPAGSGVVIVPSQGIHTFGMRFPLDIVCVTRDGVVAKYRADVPPRRLVLSFAAFAIVELSAGESARSGLLAGDRLIARIN
jgi:uncharacterized protein